MVIYFILYTTVLIFLLSVSTFGHWELFQMLFDIPTTLSSSWTTDTPGLSYMCPAPVLGSTTSPGSPGSYNRIVVLKSRIQTLVSSLFSTSCLMSILFLMKEAMYWLTFGCQLLILSWINNDLGIILFPVCYSILCRGYSVCQGYDGAGFALVSKVLPLMTFFEIW
jgi:hypothetical protein